MRVLIAGGIFRVAEAARRDLQPTPEIELALGLRNLGHEVDTIPLEDLGTLATSRRHDVVHVHHLSKAAVVAALRPGGPPFVFTRHGTGRVASWREKVGLRVVLSRLDAAVCLSQAEADEVGAGFPWVRDRLHIIPNGLTLPADPPIRRTAPAAQVRLLFVGQLIELKQVSRLLHTLARRPDHTVRLVYHNADLELSLRDEAARLGVSERVTFVGQRSGDALQAEYRDADLLVLPSRVEALPSVVTEALATGLPVVASDVGGIAGQVKGAGVLVAPAGSESLLDGLDRALSDYDTLARAAHQRAGVIRETFSVVAMAVGHADLYRSLQR